ncbi:hypothetical protein GCM10010921_29460 [Microbacterium album]|uniref:Uncharacterized protein n=1 Tax=Microbacterium album TaxID=2053191 RepID=A0A917MN48_9MICO|nr:hypothetical protein GCM10010921_29460 [Microbacterium album]
MLTIQGYSDGRHSTITYTHRAAGTYPGYGVAVPNRGRGTYCLAVTVSWVWGIIFAEERSGTGCVTI